MGAGERLEERTSDLVNYREVVHHLPRPTVEEGRDAEEQGTEEARRGEANRSARKIPQS